ncbi:hypothetical protein CFP56_007505 [Quercus suber]|uniref:Uncharacterized protein n=1 Tax=Quercus suber TaxID=58331 RepID=A0AAW0L769_QUESU
MKNLIGEALCGICQESFSTTITGTYTINLGFGELAIEVFCLLKKKKAIEVFPNRDFLCVCTISMVYRTFYVCGLSKWLLVSLNCLLNPTEFMTCLYLFHGDSPFSYLVRLSLAFFCNPFDK